MKMTQLSVSSVILAAVLSGCSQQQVSGGSQSYGGSQQSSGGSQVSQGSSQQQVVYDSSTNVPPPTVRKVSSSRITSMVKTKPRATHSVSRSNNGLPNAKPGQCYAKVKVLATYKTQSRRVLLQKASTKKVFVRAPQYRWVSKKVLVRKAVYKSTIKPAQYKTTVSKVLVKPAYNTWRKGHGAITRIDNMTGEIMCRVTVPAQYKNVEKRVLVSPSKTIRTLVPAVYKTVRTKKKVSPALFKSVYTPARYKTENYRVKVAGTRYVWRPVLCKTNTPKNYRKPTTVYRKAIIQHKPVIRSATSRKQYRKSGISYQDYIRVMNAGSSQTKLNKTSASKKTISMRDYAIVMNSGSNYAKIKKKVAMKKAATMKKPVKLKSRTVKTKKLQTKKGIVFGIQRALSAKGYNPGKIDGKLGPSTASALKKFQSSRGLPIGLLNKDTFRALGLIR